MTVGIVCYAALGGSGIVATELALALAARGHDAHIVSTDPPFRLTDPTRVGFHRVDPPGYPLFREPQYLLALATTLAQVARRHRLEIVHAHYAVPHATAAYLARQMLAAAGARAVPRVVTTLHGTDITLVGSDPSYADAVAFSIDSSDGVTAVSESLRADTYRTLRVRAPITVIPNFLDCQRYRRRPDPERRARLCPPDRFDALVMHASNFRPVKRVPLVIEIFRRIRAHVRARLLLVGGGPDLPAVRRAVEACGLEEAVLLAGEQHDPVPWLSAADLFLLPSAQESFGLAALEAMACEVPVVASRVGGLPEVITDGVDGFLRDPDDIEGMADVAVRLLGDAALRREVGSRAAATVRERFCTERIVPMYERVYAEVAGR
ncbi:MAG TPA: N-acetyl-alpha-D-glucosaminyl L-malate synthase BshA [Vicinamibacterales bacterium]|nr:N-acetyl-alpha-D-glucosaminyl L-malate synthase BshA [Vicinamibacterales bacterium]